jgi:hypothetical protein
LSCLLKADNLLVADPVRIIRTVNGPV